MNPKRSVTLLQSFFQDWRDFSFGVACGRLVRDVPIGDCKARKNYYDAKVLAYIESRLQTVIDKYTEMPVAASNNARKIIWTMWWQGEEAMPPIVRACWRQLEYAKKTSGYEVILITEQNLLEYCSLPDWIIDKIEQEISLTHLSDIVRVFLLAQYGGIWVDATVYANDLSRLLGHRFSTIFAPGAFPIFVSDGIWSSYVLGVSRRNERYLKCMYEMLIAYWMDSSRPVDYLLIDYIFMICLQNFPEMMPLISENKKDYGFYWLNMSINEEYDPSEFKSNILASPIQKLTYKKELHRSTSLGKETYYGFLIRMSEGAENC